jgi:hypothetical protein
MFKTMPRRETQTSVGTTARCVRPLSQRVLAGLLAVTFTVSSCGDAFDASPQDAPKTASAGMPRDGGLPIGTFTDSSDAEALEAGKLTKGPTAKNLSDSIPLDQCAITRTYELRNLSYRHKQNIEAIWRSHPDHDELRRRLAVHSESHPGTREHARFMQHYFPGSFNHRTNFTIKFDRIRGDNAYFYIKVYAPGNQYSNGVSRAQCRAISDDFRQIQRGNGRRLKADEATWTQVFVSLLVGAVVAIGTTSLATYNLTNTTYVAPNGICVGATVSALVFLVWTGQIHSAESVAGKLGAAFFSCIVGNANTFAKVRIDDYKKHVRAMAAAAAAAAAASGIAGAQAVELGSGEIQEIVARTAQAAVFEMERAVAQGDPRLATGAGAQP